jgi:hypothetical protein
MELKIWHNSNIGHLPTFERSAPDVETAKVWINLLWDYDLYHYGPQVPANASGLLQFNEETCEWEEWEDCDGNSISMIMLEERERADQFSRKLKRMLAGKGKVSYGKA